MLFISPIFVLRNEYENKYDDYYNNDIYQNLNQDKNVINEDKNKKFIWWPHNGWAHTNYFW